ncbi:hypothetical protein Tco_1510993 [Tanacetum coccineum]
MLQIFSQRHLMSADETVYKEWEDRMERAATTASSLDTEQDSVNINRTQSMATLNESFPQGTDSGSSHRLHTWKWGGQYETIGIDGTLYKIVTFEIDVNTGNSNLMLLALVTAARLLNAVRHNLAMSV